MVEIFKHYLDVLKDGCNKDCQHCDLYLPNRKECYIIAEEKWQNWTDERHKKFGEMLKG